MTFFARFILSCDIRTNFGKNICTSLLSPRSHAQRVPYDGDFRICVMRYKSKYFNPFFVTLFKKSRWAWSFGLWNKLFHKTDYFLDIWFAFREGFLKFVRGLRARIVDGNTKRGDIKIFPDKSVLWSILFHSPYKKLPYMFHKTDIYINESVLWNILFHIDKMHFLLKVQVILSCIVGFWTNPKSFPDNDFS